MAERGMKITDPVLLELHVLVELQEVFCQKYAPRYRATVDDETTRRCIDDIVEETRLVQSMLHEALANWIASGPAVHVEQQRLGGERETFLQHLLLFKEVGADVLERAAGFAPGPGVAATLRECAARQKSHAAALASVLDAHP